jgi:hypothetical protein
VSLGETPVQGDLYRSSAVLVGGRVAPDSVYGLLHREGSRLFPDAMFKDLFDDVGRRSAPPQIVATVMVLQRLEGLSDREAVERFEFDNRWKYAAGGLDVDYPAFVHTVLVDMRARLARSDRPNRIFDAVADVARQAGLVGRRRVVDSTPLYDAVATMDTVTLIRSAVRGLLREAGAEWDARLRARLRRDDDYARAGKPVCDYDDPEAREALVDALAKDALALLAELDGQSVPGELKAAAVLLARVTGQDLDEGEDGVFRIARRVAPDRVVSTVDPDARHGHKTSARGFDGYKGTIADDPDSEIITGTVVTAGNVGDGEVALAVLGDDLPAPGDDGGGEPFRVYGDAAYGTGGNAAAFESRGVDNKCRTQPPANRDGLFTKDEFTVDLESGTVTCPAGHAAGLTRRQDGTAVAPFGRRCRACPLAGRCTRSARGRKIRIGPHEAVLQRVRTAQADPAWKQDYRAVRPKVERKIGHLMRRRHGGRRARVRGLVKVAADFSLLAAAVNLSRLAVLRLTSLIGGGWAAQPA